MKRIDKEAMTAALNKAKSTRPTQDYSKSTDTLPHQLNGKSINMSIPDWIHIKFKEGFMQRWTATELPSTWIQGISVLSPNQIRTAVSQSLLNGDGWPPALPEFIAMGKGLNIDSDESFYRMVKREPMLNRVEEITRNEMQYICRRESEKVAKKLWAKQLKINIEKEAKGWFDLPDRPRIEKKAEKSGLEKLSDSFDPNKASFETKALMDRIKRISK